MLLTACASTRSPGATVLPWLEGRWTGPSDGAQYTETWVRLPSGALRGTSRMVRDEASPPLFTEELSIAVRDGALVYRSLPSGQAQTDFRATRVGVRDAVFENPTHDWPTRVAYALRADGTLDITVDGPAPDAGGTRALRLQLRRAPTVHR